MNPSNKTYLINILIILSSALFFIPAIGNVHLFDWDEINFAEAAREMIVSKNYSIVQINFEPFWEKPPLFIWMQALSMHLFGINEFAARFPNAVCAIITLPALFIIGKKHFGMSFGVLWMLAYVGSILPHFYFKSAIIDPWFNLFIFLGIYHIIIFINNSISNKNLIFSAIFIGLAVLTKGPVALLIFMIFISIFWITNWFQAIATAKQVLLFFSVFFLIGGTWFLYLILSGNHYVVVNFIKYQIALLTTEDSGHSGFFMYHFAVLLLGCFPASIFSLPAISPLNIFIPVQENGTPFRLFFKKCMLLLFWVVLIIFSIVKTKIIHYSSLCYFPITFFSAYTIDKFLHKENEWKNWMNILTISFASLLGILFVFISLIEKFKPYLLKPGVINDVFAAENLKAEVHWTGWEWLIGVIWIISNIAWSISIKKTYLTFALYFGVSAIMIHLIVLTFVPKAEQYTQNAAIEFFKKKQNEDCVVETVGYISYAQYFYAQQKESSINSSKVKTSYLVSKITDEENVIREHPEYREISRKNGFIFWLKENNNDKYQY